MTPEFQISAIAPLTTGLRHPLDMRAAEPMAFWEEFQLAVGEASESEANKSAVDLRKKQVSESEAAKAEDTATEHEKLETLDTTALADHDEAELIPIPHRPSPSSEQSSTSLVCGKQASRMGEMDADAGTSVVDPSRQAAENAWPVAYAHAPLVPSIPSVAHRNGRTPTLSTTAPVPLTEVRTRAAAQAMQPCDAPRPTLQDVSKPDVGMATTQAGHAKLDALEDAQDMSSSVPDTVLASGLTKTQSDRRSAAASLARPNTTATTNVLVQTQQTGTVPYVLEVAAKQVFSDVSRAVSARFVHGFAVAGEPRAVTSLDATQAITQPSIKTPLDLSKAGAKPHLDAINLLEGDLRVERQQTRPLEAKPTSMTTVHAVVPHAHSQIKQAWASATGLSSQVDEVTQRSLHKAEDALSFGAVPGADRPSFVASNSGPDGVFRALPSHVPEIVRQMADALPRVAETALEITLKPEELGRIRLTLVAAETGSVLHVAVERPETLELVRRHLGLLTQEFAAQGFGHLDVALGGRQGAPAHLVSSDEKAAAQPEIPNSDGLTVAGRVQGFLRLGDTLDIRI